MRHVRPSIFNNYVPAAAQRIERTNALLGRYFAPEVRKEIETLEMDPTKQDPNRMLRSCLPTSLASQIFQKRCIQER